MGGPGTFLFDCGGFPSQGQTGRQQTTILNEGEAE